MAQITNVSLTRHVGRYNWADPSQEEAQIVVRATIDGQQYALSDTVYPDSEWDFHGDDISDAIDAIEAAKGRYLFYSGREEFAQRLTIFRAHEQEIRKAYALSQAAYYQRRARETAKLAQAWLWEALEKPEPADQAEAA